MTNAEFLARVRELPVWASATNYRVTVHHFEDEWWVLWDNAQPGTTDLGRRFAHLTQLLRFLMTGHGGEVLRLADFAPDLC